MNEEGVCARGGAMKGVSGGGGTPRAQERERTDDERERGGEEQEWKQKKWRRERGRGVKEPERSGAAKGGDGLLS